jgi:hypothetical protein
MLTVGVTGHRYVTENEKIEKGVDTALLHILEVYTPEKISIHTSLAEGADRLVLQRTLQLFENPHIIVPLPFPKDQYLKDFPGAKSKEEFNELINRADKVITFPPAKTKNKSYQIVGEYILDHSDIMVAIWDGKPPQGQGGTGDIINAVRNRNLPLAWIHAGNRKPGTHEPTSLGEEQGKVTFERFPKR